MTTTRTPPTGHRDEDGKLHDLDFNDPDTMAWISAKQRDHEAAEANRQRNLRRKAKKTLRQQRKRSRT